MYSPSTQVYYYSHPYPMPGSSPTRLPEDNSPYPPAYELNFDGPHCPESPSYDSALSSCGYLESTTCVPRNSEVLQHEDVGSLETVDQWQPSPAHDNLPLPLYCGLGPSESCTNHVQHHATTSQIYVPSPPVLLQPLMGERVRYLSAYEGCPSTLVASPTDSYVPDGMYSQPSPSYPDQLRFDDLEPRHRMGGHLKTFPTPSEMLYEIQNSGYATSPISDSSSESSIPPSRPVHPHADRGLDPSSQLQLGLDPFPTEGMPVRDGISSHEKKRQLLECLEQYVMFLHERLALIGEKPVPLERVFSNAGLSSRSIRTLLVHMEYTNRKLNSKIVAEENRFLRLQEAYRRLGSSSTSANVRYSRS